MFQFRRFPAYAYLIQRTLSGYCPDGLPHSEIPGSMDICSSPRLIAACHVLHRLLMPRHSPCALSSLTNRRRNSLRSVSAFRRKTHFRSFLLLFLANPFHWASLGVLGSLELCRPHKDFEIVIVTHLYDVPQLKFAFPVLFQAQKPLCCLTSLAFITLFSFQGATFQLLLQSDLKIQPFSWVFKSSSNLLGGPEWARTTDLTIISRTL